MTLPFGWCESPMVYATPRVVKARYLRRKGIPTLSYIDDSWGGNSMDLSMGSVQQQWVAAAKALRFAVSVSCLCGYYLAEANCVLVPTQTLRYLGIICDSRRAVFRILS